MEGKYILCIVVGGVSFLSIIIAFQQAKKQTQPELNENCYILSLPKWYVVFGVISAIIFFLADLYTMKFLETAGDLWYGSIFIILEIGGTYLAIYSLLWKIVVEEELLIIYSPFFSIRNVRIYEIHKIVDLPKDIVIYDQNNKLFFISKTAIGYEILYQHLKNNGKINRITKEENFSIETDTHTKVVSIFLMLLFCGMFILMLFWEDEKFEIYLYVGILALALLSLYFCYESFIWKVTVSYKTISVRNKFGRKTVYLIHEIAMVYLEKDKIGIYVGDKKAASICRSYENTLLLIKLLEDEGVVIYDSEKGLKY